MTDRMSRLSQIISDNPGIWFREIMRQSGMQNGVLDHYLRKMESAGIIRVNRTAGRVSYSSLSITEAQLLVARALRRPTQRAILLELAACDGLSFKRLVVQCDKSQSTISKYLNMLVNENLVYVKRREKVALYYLNCKDDVDRLVEEYAQKFMDRPVSGMEDIICSL